MRVLSDEKIEELWHSSGAPHTGVIGFARAIEAAVQRPIADLMCQWKSGKISGDELADKLFSLFASTPSSAVLEAQEKQEPVAWLARGIHGGKVIAAKLHDYKQDADNTASVFIEHYGAAETVPLYAAPVVSPDMVMEGFKAACAFIDSHVADPDITSEMRKTYAEFMRMRAMIAAAEVKG